jgi:hypothetical protein
MQHNLPSFLQKISESFSRQELIKITLGNKRDKSAELKNIFIKPVTIKNMEKLSFTYRNNTNDTFKNYDIKESLILIEKMLQTDFYNADLFTAQNDFHLSADKKETIKIITRPASLQIKDDAKQHDKQKKTCGRFHHSTILKGVGHYHRRRHSKKRHAG